MSGQVERSKQLDSIDQCTKDIKEDTKQILGCLRGKEAPVDPNQSDKDRLKEIRLIKRNLDNEVGDIKDEELEGAHTGYGYNDPRVVAWCESGNGRRMLFVDRWRCGVFGTPRHSQEHLSEPGLLGQRFG